MTAKFPEPKTKSSALSHGIVIVGLIALTCGLVLVALLPFEVMQKSAENISKVKVSENHFSNEFNHGEPIRITDEELGGEHPELLSVPSLDSFYAGRKCFNQGHFQEAIDYVTKSIKQYETEKHTSMDYQRFDLHVARYDLRAYCYYRLKNYQAALSDLSHAIEIHAYAGDLRKRALLYRLLGKDDLARQDLKRAASAPEFTWD